MKFPDMFTALQFMDINCVYKVIITMQCMHQNVQVKICYYMTQV